jgi:fumarate hydratase class II
MAKEALRSGRTIRELARERGFSDADLDRIMDPAKLTEPGLDAGAGGGG